MKEYKTKSVLKTYVSRVLCDKCNNKVDTGDTYDVFDFELSLRTGEQYPDCGFGDKLEIHLCKTCAKKLFQELKENGYRINESEWDT
jgi:hypothetical protein